MVFTFCGIASLTGVALLLRSFSRDAMNMIQIPDLTKLNTKRCTMWLSHDQWAYIKDLAHSSECRQRDVIHYIIAEYMESHPRIKLDMPSPIGVK